MRRAGDCGVEETKEKRQFIIDDVQFVIIKKDDEGQKDHWVL